MFSSQINGRDRADRRLHRLLVVFPCAVLLLVLFLSGLSLSEVIGKTGTSDDDGGAGIPAREENLELLLDWTGGSDEVTQEDLALLREGADLRSVPVAQRLLRRGEKEVIFSALLDPMVRDGFQVQVLLLLRGDRDPRVREVAAKLLADPRSHAKVKSVCRTLLADFAKREETES